MCADILDYRLFSIQFGFFEWTGTRFSFVHYFGRESLETSTIPNQQCMWGHLSDPIAFITFFTQ